MLNLDPKQIRKRILEIAFDAISGHIGCAFSIVEIITVLYRDILKINPANPLDPNRDYFILSKGHGALCLYVCLNNIGWISDEDLNNYFKDNSKLTGLTEFQIPGIEVSGGSLGHGFPVATGIAYGLQRRKSSQKVFCLVGDGELNEGTIWESLLFASHHSLNNLTIIVDYNKFQAMGKNENIINLEPLAKKFEAFGCVVHECDGHNLKSIYNCLNSSSALSKPKIIICHTVKGYGVSFMQNQNIWHYKKLTKELYLQALQEL